jgi:hypothetical protein
VDVFLNSSVVLYICFCICMTYSTSYSHFRLTLDPGNGMYVCMHISECMKWGAHVRSPSSKLSAFCHMIKFLQDIKSLHVIRSIYFVYFYSNLRYDLILWGGDSKSKGIFKLQKRVIRIMSGVRKHASCR